MKRSLSLKLYFIFFFLLFLNFSITSCSNDDGEGGGISSTKLTGIWVHSNKYGKYDYVFAFRDNMAFEEEVWQYTNKNDFLQRYNNDSYWVNYSLSGNTLIVGDFISKINIDGKTFSYTDGDGKKQSFTLWNGTMESFLDKVLYNIDPEDEKNDNTETTEVPQNLGKAPSGVYPVDLGLSVKWANCNLGSSTPEGYGDYYAWTDVVPINQESGHTTYIDYGVVDQISGTKYDAAYIQWGGGWRMPTDAECDELKQKCSKTWIKQNGIEGLLVTGPNGNSIFLPATKEVNGTFGRGKHKEGNYWTASKAPYNYDGAGEMNISEEFKLTTWNTGVEYGLSVRPVYGERILPFNEYHAN